MRDHAPVTETTFPRTLDASFEGRETAASGNLAGGPARPSAPLFPYPAHRPDSGAGEGCARGGLSSRQALCAPRNPRVRLVLDLLGDLVGAICLFFILFAGLLLGGIQ